MLDEDDDYLEHYGTPRHSGRYPWGSGKDPFQTYNTTISAIEELRNKGIPDTQIARSLGISSTKFRNIKGIALEQQQAARNEQMIGLINKGYSNVKIGEIMGTNESTIRSWRSRLGSSREKQTQQTVDQLKNQIKEKGVIDVGKGTALALGISETQLSKAITKLQAEGYYKNYIQVDQLGVPGKKTTIMFLTSPTTNPKKTWKEINADPSKVALPDGHYDIDKKDFTSDVIQPIQSISSKRVNVRYNEEGGLDKDGTIEIRRGVDDLSLGNARYAQVRIGVDGTHYLKGMAYYSDDVPKGYDVVFNTNKHVGTPMISEDKDSSVLKPMKKNKEGVYYNDAGDPEHAFGASFRQHEYIGKDGKKHVSAVNVVREEGEWGEWSRNIASQVLSKQAPSLAKKQLSLALKQRQDEFDEYSKLTNPAVKKKLLDSFSDSCDADAVHLKAAALPRQSFQVILPVPDLDENQIYAPNYEPGEKVALVRYPHGGKFEMPILTVNNKHASAKKMLGNAKDAVGISSKVAERLSGADFDGDTVLVIPTRNINISNKPALKDLKGFSPTESYPAVPGMQRMKNTQTEMGKISNLITDMTIKGATDDELARAVRHSMVVIDAEKHNLNYKLSFEQNGIAALKKKYQGATNAGASTLISRSKSEYRVLERKQHYDINPETGEKIYKLTGKTYTVYAKNPLTGKPDYSKPLKEVPNVQKSTKMAEAKDARTLSSGSKIEDVYADYANAMKALGNKARKESYFTKPTEYDPQAKVKYAKEVSQLTADLNLAKKNAPLERHAQAIANTKLKMLKDDNPDLTKAEAKKYGQQYLQQARSIVGAGKTKIDITENEWDAIQDGALSYSKLNDVLYFADMDKVKELATPRRKEGLSQSKIQLAKAYLNAGYSRSDVAKELGISTSEIIKYVES